jgi:hypothetical protein
MGNRREQRAEAKLNVKLWGTDAAGKPFIDPATTCNLSGHGVRLEGVQRALKVGDAVGLTYNNQKARFRVVWVGRSGSPQEGHVGLECTTVGKCIWDVPLPTPEVDTFVKPRLGDRREFPRFECNMGIEIRLEEGKAPLHGKLVDLSLGGCYVEMMVPLRVGAKVELNIWIGDTKVWTPATITSSHPGFGIGIKFIGMGRQEREVVEKFLQSQVRMDPPDRRLGPRSNNSHPANAFADDPVNTTVE